MLLIYISNVEILTFNFQLLNVEFQIFNFDISDLGLLGHSSQKGTEQKILGRNPDL